MYVPQARIVIKLRYLGRGGGWSQVRGCWVTPRQLLCDSRLQATFEQVRTQL